jgi:hypothetical protein
MSASGLGATTAQAAALLDLMAGNRLSGVRSAA